jgi:TorA maturation chaperone TorD
MSAGALAPEDEARSNFYALLARLFYAPPDSALLAAIAAAPALAAEDAGAPLAAAWQALQRVASGADPEVVRAEFDEVFVGTGKAEVTLYLSAYLGTSVTRDPLVLLRDFLAERGLQRRQAVHEPEDHVAALCEVMRHLIVAGDAASQRECFATFLAPASDGLCDAIIQCERIDFYRPVARLAKIFFTLEHSAFDMD